jgi:transposase
MAKYKYTNRKQMEMICVNLEDQILPGTFEYALDDIIDNHVDLSIFDNKYKNDNKGAKAYPINAMLKIVLYSYSLGIISSRVIEYQCRKNTVFMALSCGITPDHSTIADFISDMEEEAIEVFIKVLLFCDNLGLLGKEMFAVDGCKLSSNASKEMSGTFKDFEKKIDKTSRIVKKLVEKHKSIDDKELKESLEKKIKKYNNKVSKFEKFMKDHEKKRGHRNRERKSNITDNESAKMFSSHGYIQGYNGINVVDKKHQVVIYPEAFGTVGEAEVFKGTMNEARKIAAKAGISKDIFKGKKVICDTGYFSEANCKYIDDNNIDGYIPDQYFRQRDPRYPEKNEYRKKKNLYTQEDFKYDEENDYYVCPDNKKLVLHARNIKVHGHRGRRYDAKKIECQNCFQKHKCLKKGASRRTLFVIIESPDKTYSKKMIEKIDKEESREIYSQRMGIVEPVFGNVTYHKRLNRFTLRGKKKVNVQWVLYMMVHNIEKILNYGDKYKVKV